MVRAGILRSFHLYFRAFREVRTFWPALTLILALGYAWIPISLLLPIPLKIVVDNVLGGKPLDGPAAWLVPSSIARDPDRLLAAAIGISVALGLLGLAYKFADWFFREAVADRMVHRFRGRLLLHGLRLPALYHAENGTLDLGYRVNQDAPALQWTAIYGVIPLLVSASSVGCTLYVTAMISAKLALVAVATAVPTIAVVHLYQQRLKAKWHVAKEADSAAQALVHEVLGALRLVTLFGQERRETERFMAQSQIGIAARLRAIRTEGALGALLAISAVMGTAVILYLGAGDVKSGTLSIGDLLMVVAYIGQLYAPLQAIGTHFSGQQHAVASMERAFAILDQDLAVSDRPGARPLARARGEVRFSHVSFAYGGRSPVLRDADFVIPAGTVVGIVGPTGAGKTTLVNLLLRLFDPTEGEVMLDGVDLRDWRLADLRRQFAVVPQDALLFSTSLAENIAYGRPEASADEITAAAQAAKAHEFIMSQADGYDTRVGERGARLSGGERQRIALARALLTDAPIVVLDEPTSAVDNRTEAAIIESLERLRHGRTVFIVAHRLATLRHVDVLLRVAEGEVSMEENEDMLHLRRAS